VSAEATGESEPQAEARLADLLRYNLKAVRAYLLKEDFQLLWHSRSLAAREFLKRWCTCALRSRIEPVKKVAHLIRRHQELLLNWFRARGTISSGPTKGLNNRLKLTLRKACGFRTFRAMEVELYHSLVALPELECIHKFW
jgi:transposase